MGITQSIQTRESLQHKPHWYPLCKTARKYFLTLKQFTGSTLTRHCWNSWSLHMMARPRWTKYVHYRVWSITENSNMHTLVKHWHTVIARQLLLEPSKHTTKTITEILTATQQVSTSYIWCLHTTQLYTKYYITGIIRTSMTYPQHTATYLCTTLHKGLHIKHEPEKWHVHHVMTFTIAFSRNKTILLSWPGKRNNTGCPTTCTMPLPTNESNLLVGGIIEDLFMCTAKKCTLSYHWKVPRLDKWNATKWFPYNSMWIALQNCGHTFPTPLPHSDDTNI